MSNWKKMILLMVTCFFVINLTACWDNRDLTEMGIATAVGFDQTEGGDIEVTVQLVKPGVIKAKAQGSPEESFWGVSATGQTVFSALRNLVTTVNREIFLAHIELMVIGEELARDGIIDVIDFFEREHESNRRASVIIARGIKAREILAAKSELENIPAIHITSTLENNTAVAKMVNIQFIDLIKCLNAPGYSPAIGVIQHRKREDNPAEKLKIKDLEVEGAAVFKKDQLIGWLDPIETRGLIFARDQVQTGIINTDNPLERGKKVSCEVVRSNGTIDVELKQGKPLLIIEVKAEGRLGEQQGKGDLTTPEMIKRLEKDISKVIEKNVLTTVELLQHKYKSDIFGFSTIVHRKYLDYWNQVEDQWDQIFSQADVKVKASWKIRSSAIIKQPSQAK